MLFQVLDYETSANAKLTLSGYGLEFLSFTRTSLHPFGTHALACFSISPLLLYFGELNLEVPSQHSLSKIPFKDFREIITSRAVCFTARLSIYLIKPWNCPLLLWWVGFPELFSLPAVQSELDPLIQVSSFLRLADLYFCF